MWQCPDPQGKTFKNGAVFYPLYSGYSTKYKTTLFLIRTQFVRIFSVKFAKTEVFLKVFFNPVIVLGTSPDHCIKQFYVIILRLVR